MAPVIHPSGGHLWQPEPVLPIPTVGARRRLASRGGSGRRSGRFLGSMVLAAPSPFRSKFAEVSVSMISLPRKLWESLSSCFLECDGGGF